LSKEIGFEDRDLKVLVDIDDIGEFGELVEYVLLRVTVCEDFMAEGRVLRVP
jgi:hypothetical protein